jgi:ABC-type antimicrobial peptide transport system permease subunit
MRRRHRSSTKNPEDFLVQNQDSLAETQLAATRRLGFLVRAVGAAGLLVADLGILATAWMGVRARTTEIGCRRALGASGATIFRQLLGAAAALSLAGGAAGALVAFASVAGAQHYGSGMTLRAGDFLAAPALAVGLNLLFSFVPARQAASVPPMRALRSE